MLAGLDLVWISELSPLWLLSLLDNLQHANLKAAGMLEIVKEGEKFKSLTTEVKVIPQRNSAWPQTPHHWVLTLWAFVLSVRSSGPGQQGTCSCQSSAGTPLEHQECGSCLTQPSPLQAPWQSQSSQSTTCACTWCPSRFQIEDVSCPSGWSTTNIFNLKSSWWPRPTLGKISKCYNEGPELNMALGQRTCQSSVKQYLVDDSSYNDIKDSHTHTPIIWYLTTNDL